MERLLQGALVANAASLGKNWIYNMSYLKQLAEKESIVFTAIDPAVYKSAGKSYLAYPRHKIGDFSFQGTLATWLLKWLKETPNLTREDYIDRVYEMVQPTGPYDGYAESYIKTLCFNKLSELLNTNVEPLVQDDTQLVGFIPYLVVKSLNQPKENAWELAQAFTNNTIYLAFYNYFDRLLLDLKRRPHKSAIKASLDSVPNAFKTSFKKAVEMTNTNQFIQDHSGTACGIDDALPLIIHIAYHSTSYEDAIRKNTIIGGASSDRGMLLGALMQYVSDIPQAWIKQTHM
ncbi:MAG: ADP-ribosylglycohydrolase family protein [Bacillota bacterium]